MKSRLELSRRLFLGGVGAAVGLPIVDSLLPFGGQARAQSASTPRRLVFFIVSFGSPEWQGAGYGQGYTAEFQALRTNVFRPKETGTAWTTPTCLQPLADLGLKGDVTVITGLHNYITREPPYAGDDHQSLTQGILTGVSPINANGVAAPPTAAISVDQIAANYLKTYTPGLPSLEIGTYLDHNVYDNYCWRDANTPISRILDPKQAFNRVFGDPTASQLTQDALVRRNRRRTKILDYAKSDLNRLKQKIGAGDRQRLDQYLTSVDNLETRIANQPTTQCATGTAPNGYADVRQQATQMLDLIPLAFQCDRTRVVSFTLEAQTVFTKYPFLPSPSDGYGHHSDMSHPTYDPIKLQAYIDMTRWKVSMYAYLLDKLKKTPEVDGSGSLLDNTTVVFLSEMGYGDGHVPRHLPVIVGGRGGGAFTPGKHIVVGDNLYAGLTNNKPIADLYINLLQSIGLNKTSFGSYSTGPVAGL